MILDDCVIRKWTAREYSLFGGISLCPGMSGLSGFVSSLQPGFESRAHHVCFSDLINIVIFIQLCNNYREKLTTWQKFGKNHWQPFFHLFCWKMESMDRFLFFFILLPSFVYFLLSKQSQLVIFAQNWFWSMFYFCKICSMLLPHPPQTSRAFKPCLRPGYVL